jgi:amphi-Trp domain-containing protein
MASKDSSKEKVQFAGTVPAQEAAQYLESIAKGLRERAMLLESGDTSMNVEVTDDVKIEIQVSAAPEKGKAAIEVSISWRAKQDEEIASPPGLLIVPGAQPAEVAVLAE